jgi:shikimate kinase
MRQIIFIGFSTTGKSTLINKIVDTFPQRIKFDTDEEIAKDYDQSIANIYYSNNIDETHTLIKSLEENILLSLKSSSDNLIIAAGPGIPFKNTFPEYIKSKNPHVVLLEKSAGDIYKSLLDRRNKMKQQLHHQRPDFGVWDIEVMVDKNLIEYTKEEAIQKIQLLLDQRKECYNKYATLKVNAIDLYDRNLPKELLDIII